MNKLNRIPRPLGLTHTLHLYHKTNDNEHRDTANNILISHYVSNNFTICGIPYSVPQIALTLNISEAEIYKAIEDKLKSLSLVINPNDIQETFRVLSTTALNFSLGDKALVQRQLALLLESQGDSYKPFISGEINQAIKTSNDLTKTILDILKTLSGPSQTQIFIDNSTKDNNNYLTTEAALELIQKKGSNALEQGREDLYLEHELSSCPEVNAIRQTNVDTAKEGLNIKNLTKIKHEDRRAHEEEIDIEDHVD